MLLRIGQRRGETGGDEAEFGGRLGLRTIRIPEQNDIDNVRSLCHLKSATRFRELTRGGLVRGFGFQSNDRVTLWGGATMGGRAYRVRG